jgi:carnitine 3-dehydrogenase
MVHHSRIAVIGFGLIGQSWAALFQHFGYDVAIWDPDSALLESARDLIAPKLAQIVEIHGDAHQIGSLIVEPTIANAVGGAWLIQENAPERVSLKHQLLAEVEQSCPSNAIIASSTSSLTWTDLAPGLTRPNRLITAHPFNPPHIMPLVELYGVDSGIVGRAEDFYRSLARETVRLNKPAVGHIANRLASALWREAVNMVAEDIAGVDAIDRALRAGPGLRWSVVGAHMAYHLGGGVGGMRHYLEHLGSSQERRWQDLGTPRLSPELCELLISGVEEEAAGRSISTLEAERDAALIAILRDRSDAHV